MLNYRPLILTFVIAFFLFSCRSIKPGVPALPPEAYDAPAPPPSEIDIPVSVDLKPLYDQVERNVPLKLNSTGYPNWENSDNCNLQYKWNFWREKLTFTPKNNTLLINCIGYYQGEGRARPCCWDFCPWAGAGCGMDGTPRQLQLGISSTVSLMPDYRISASTTVTKLLPINRCYVTSLNFDITDVIINQARPPIEQACKDFDKSMAAYNVKKEVETVWKMMNTPIAIDTLGFLVFRPTALRVGPLTTNGNILNFSLGATTAPRFLLNTQGLAAPAPLPNISPNTAKGSGFSVYLDTRLPYAELNKIINAQMQGMRFDFGKRHIEVLEVKLEGTGNKKLMIKVNFKGSAKGWIYLTGTPQFDSATKELTLPDLDFDVKTQNMLLKSAKWLFNAKITTTMRQNARYSVAAMLELIKTQITLNLNRDLGNGVKTQGKVIRLDITNIYPTPGFIQVTTLIKGDMNAQVTGLK